MKTFFKITSIVVISVFCFTSCENELLSEDINIEQPVGPPGSGEVLVDEIIGDWLISDYQITTTNVVDFEGTEITTVAETTMVKWRSDINVYRR